MTPKTIASTRRTVPNQRRVADIDCNKGFPMDLEKLAYKGAPIPDGLQGGDRLQYILLRAIYQAFKCGDLTRDEGEGLKHFFTRYACLSARDKAALLRTGFILLTDMAGRGDPLALEDSKTVAHAFHDLTNREILKGATQHGKTQS